MKKTLLAVLSAVSLLFAESYQVNTLSASQLGMANTGAALKLGAQSMHFNPGALGFLDKTLDVSAGITFIMPEVEIWGSKGLTTNTKLGTPLYVYAASNILPWLSAGISFTTPYGNSADYGKNWEGAGLLQEIALSVYAVQPTIAFKPIEQLSIGGGPAIYFGSFEQSKALKGPGEIPYPGLENSSTISATFSGDADVAIAANVGILYDLIKDKLALGIAYRSEAKAKVAEGKAKVSFANETIRAMAQSQLPDLEKGTFEAELPLPANLNAGISFRPIEKLLLALDLQWIGWGSYKELDLKFTDVAFGVERDASGNPVIVGGAPVYIRNQTSLKKYNNVFCYRIGGQYSVIDMLDVRLGFYYDESPVDDEYLTPESPSTDKFGSTIGFSVHALPNLSIDAAFLYSLGIGRDSKSGEKKTNTDGIDGMNARYEVQAWVPSIGLRFYF